MSDSFVAVGFGILWVNTDCLFVIRNRFLMSAKHIFGVRSVIVDFGDLRINVDCLVIVGDGVVMPTKSSLDGSSVGVGLSIMRVDVNCLVIVKRTFKAYLLVFSILELPVGWRHKA